MDESSVPRTGAAADAIDRIVQRAAAAVGDVAQTGVEGVNAAVNKAVPSAPTAQQLATYSTGLGNAGSVRPGHGPSPAVKQSKPAPTLSQRAAKLNKAADGMKNNLPKQRP